MATATFPWMRPQPLPARVDLGPGLEPEPLTAALRQLCGVVPTPNPIWTWR